MAENKKELIDYLRNRQKAIEIKSKANGVNLWVLIAAIAALGWVSIDYFPQNFAASITVVAWSLAISQSAYYLLQVSSYVGNDSAEIRYISVEIGPHPVLSLLSSIWHLMPSVFLFVAAGKTVQTVALALISTFILFMKARSIYRLMRPGGRKKKFPDPNFIVPQRVDFVISLLFSTVFLYCIIDGVLEIKGSSSISVGLVKFSCLVSALYLMTCFAVDKKIENSTISWTYELEADLVLDLITPDVAARRIEHRSLGIRLAQVMDDFYDEMDKKISGIEEGISRIAERAEEVSKIPNEYVAERKSRWGELAQPSLDLLGEAVKSMRELVDYIGKLKYQPLNPRLKEVVEMHSARANEYLDRLAQLNDCLKKKTDEIIPT